MLPLVRTGLPRQETPTKWSSVGAAAREGGRLCRAARRRSRSQLRRPPTSSWRAVRLEHHLRHAEHILERALPEADDHPTTILAQQLRTRSTSTEFAGLGEKYEGKVRDNYTKGRPAHLVVTDRFSAFDVVLGTIPFKGQVLNQLAAHWFDETKDSRPTT